MHEHRNGALIVNAVDKKNGGERKHSLPSIQLARSLKTAPMANTFRQFHLSLADGVRCALLSKGVN